MNTEQFFAVLGTIYIAPHMHPIYGHVVGFGLLVAAVCKGLGLI
jgi:hypothetical protein